MRPQEIMSITRDKYAISTVLYANLQRKTLGRQEVDGPSQ